MEKIVNSDPEILGGTPVFMGTRVPVDILFDYLKRGRSLDYFLEEFPSVTREQTERLLDAAYSLILPEPQQKRKSA